MWVEIEKLEQVVTRQRVGLFIALPAELQTMNWTALQGISLDGVSRGQRLFRHAHCVPCCSSKRTEGPCSFGQFPFQHEVNH